MHKVAFHIGSLAIHWYGVLVAVAFLVGLWTASRRGVRDGIGSDKVLDAGVWLIAGTIIGARTLYVISYWHEDFAGKPWTEVLMIQHGGLVFYGGLFGATAACLVYVWRQRLPLWKFADTLAPSIALGYVPGRLGCLMNGCCYGRETSVPWAIYFPEDHVTHGVGVHPTQIYEMLLSATLYGCLAWLYRRKKFDGQVFATYLISYALLRSFVELFRGDYSMRYLGGVATPAHLISGAILGAGLLLYWKLPRPELKRV